MLVKEIIQKTTRFFQDKGFSSPRLDTELLLAHALGWERMKLYLNYDYPLNEQELVKARELVRRRLTGEPIAYIVGKKDFFKASFKVNSSVLIPRPETELLVEYVLTWSDSEEMNIVDFGTGSGCIGLSLLLERSESKLLAVDLSQDAIGVARENAENLGLSNRVLFMAKDVKDLQLSEVRDFFSGCNPDVIVGNPPYIAIDDEQVSDEVKKFEPGMALFSDDSGLKQISVWAQKAGQFIKPGGLVIFEIGHDQGQAASKIFEDLNILTEIQIRQDLSGLDRFVLGVRNGDIVHG